MEIWKPSKVVADILALGVKLCILSGKFATTFQIGYTHILYCLIIFYLRKQENPTHTTHGILQLSASVVFMR